MGKLNDILNAIADAIRKKGYNRTDGTPIIKASAFNNEILLFAEYGFAKNMVDSDGTGVSQLREVTIDDKITSIGEGAFKGLSITKIELHGGVNSIGASAFSGCENIKSIDLKNVKTLGINCFTQTGITDIVIPASVEKLEGANNSAFTQMYNVNSITVAEGNSRYYSKDDNGEECNVCVRKEYTSNNTTYKKTLIVGCKNSVIPEGVEVIFSDAMSSTMCPKTLVLPSTITTIAGRAFFTSSNLEELEVKSSINYSTNAFGGVGTVRLIVPSLSVWLNSSFGGSSANPMYSGVSGTTNISSSTLYVRMGEEVVLQEDIEIPTDITEIGKYSLIGCSNLKKVKFHGGITKIGEYSFAYCDNVSEYDFSELDVPPTLVDTTAFTGNHPTNWKILVKSGTLDSWKSADNWKTFTNIEESTN